MRFQQDLWGGLFHTGVDHLKQLTKKYLMPADHAWKISKKTRILFAVLIALVLSTSVVVVWTFTLLRRETDNRTKRYVSDVSAQLAQDISHRISGVTNNLILIGDGLAREEIHSDADLQEAVHAHVTEMGYESIVFVDVQGNVYQSKTVIGDALALPGIQQSLQGKNAVSFLDQKGILYSVPIQCDGEVVGVVGGLRSVENMQKLIRPDSFSGRGLTCIIDRTGEVVISPTDLAPFLELDSIFSENPESALAQNIYQMEQDMFNDRSGLFRFEAVDGSNLILVYNPLNHYGWQLLTLVPSDVIAATIERYMARTTLLSAGVIWVMATILLVLFLENRSHNRQMYRIAFVDRLTGGMNGAAFQMRCQVALRSADPGASSILALNIKNFRLIKEKFNARQGDKVLRAFMKVLTDCVAGKGFAARAEADNFLLYVETGDAYSIRKLVDQIVASARREAMGFGVGGTVPYYFVIQSGAFVINDPTLDVALIVDRANAACRDRTPLEDGVCKFYDAAVVEHLSREQELNGMFAEALSSHAFQVYLQPKVWIESGKTYGAEALVRWECPGKGLIPPSEFIPLFEANGKICELDLYMFEEVCAILRRWIDAGSTPLPISVNLSRHHFQRPDCLTPFAEIAARYGIPKGLIELELTESIFFDDPSIETVKNCIHEMHRLGFTCSLDDFGSGYSSLGLLVEFDVDVIKLDRKFFLDMDQPKAMSVISSVLSLSKEIGMRTVAEGIETQTQLEQLRAEGCDLVQGYVYSRPLPVSEFEQWCRERGK